MLKFLGVVVIVNTLLGAGWYVGTGKPWSLALTTLTIVVLVIGLALIVNERAIELSFGKVASIKAAASQVSADAAEIASIRTRVEAQAATMDLVAKESSEAKRLLSDLREENKEADEKLKALVDKTAEIQRLPEGTTIMGGILMGRPTLLQDKLDEAHNKLQSGDIAAAYEDAKKCVQMYEDSRAQSKGIAMATGGVSGEGVAVIYAFAADLAQRQNDAGPAVEWASKAVTAQPSPEHKALLVVAYLKAHRQGEAQKIVDEAVNGSDQDSITLRELLLKFGIIKPK